MPVVIVFAALLVGAVVAWAVISMGRIRAEAAARDAEVREQVRAEQLQREREFAAREVDLRDQLRDAQVAGRTDEQLLDAARVMAATIVAEQSGQLVQVAESRYQHLQERTDTILTTHDRHVSEGLVQMQQRIQQLERQRHEESASLKQMVGDLRDVTVSSRDETARLASALRDNRVRGLWGETQLRRVIEKAGMTTFCDFVEQRGVTSGERSGRPDVVVRMPNGRAVVIDAKAPLDRYLEAANCTDSNALPSLMAEHAKAVQSHVTALAKRDYRDLVDGAVDVVVMFLPGDPFLNAALDADPGLMELAWSKNVVLASPGSLFGLLRALSIGWQERRVAEEAAQIAQLGRELHERIGLFADHFAKVGGHLGRAVDSYNRAVGSMESRLLSTARKLDEAGAASHRDIPGPEALTVEAVPRNTVRELPTAG
jgi:DNA recombination protein RmuC